MCIYKYWIFKKKNNDVQQFVTMGKGGGGVREVDMMMFHKRARILLLKVHIGLLYDPDL